MVENASQYKASGLVSTGLCWNAGGIAAAIILVAAFAGSQWKVVALISSILTQSSTMIVGVGIVILFFLFQYLFSKRLKNNKNWYRKSFYRYDFYWSNRYASCFCV